MRLITANVNGIRAAARRGGLDWLRVQEPDLIALQEVRADDTRLRTVLADAGLGHWHVAHSPSSAAAGHAGVALLCRHPFLAVRTEISADVDEQGRWIEADLLTSDGPLTVASAYVHTGEAEADRQVEKYRFLDVIGARLAAWASAGTLAVLTGDLNVARSEADLRNWRGNLGKAGFLDGERAVLDRWCTTHVVDVHRVHAGAGPGPYTWWSWRGRAFDNDAGWRIDYQLATRPLAERVTGAWVGRAPSYAQRWSDHAPLVVDYALDVAG